MVPSTHRNGRLCVLGFAILLYGAMFWRWLTGPSPWTEQEEKWGNRLAIALFGLMVALGYLWSSTECAMGRDCLIANADLANWLFGK